MNQRMNLFFPDINNNLKIEEYFNVLTFVIITLSCRSADVLFLFQIKKSIEKIYLDIYENQEDSYEIRNIYRWINTETLLKYNF